MIPPPWLPIFRSKSGRSTGWHYPNGLNDYMAALSAFLADGQPLSPVMNAAGLSIRGRLVLVHAHAWEQQATGTVPVGLLDGGTEVVTIFPPSPRSSHPESDRSQKVRSTRGT